MQSIDIIDSNNTLIKRLKLNTNVFLLGAGQHMEIDGYGTYFIQGVSHKITGDLFKTTLHVVRRYVDPNE